MDTMVDNEISLFDMFVIDSLNEILNKKDVEKTLIPLIAKKAEKEFDFTEEKAKHHIKESLRKLKKNGTLKSFGIVCDPTKLYGDVYLFFIKTHLPSFLGPLAAMAWEDAFARIWEINKKYGKPVKMLFNIGGMGEYDFVGIAYVNNQKNYHDFKAALVKEGFIEKFDTKYVEAEGGFEYDLLEYPDYGEYEKFLIDRSKRLDKIRKGMK